MVSIANFEHVIAGWATTIGFYSIKRKLRLCTGSNTVRGMSEFWNGWNHINIIIVNLFFVDVEIVTAPIN